MNNDLANELMDESSSFFVSIHDFIRESTSSFNKTNNKSTIEKDVTIKYMVEWLKILDSIAILFYQGRVDSAQVLTRTLFEITLQLCYLTKDKKYVRDKAGYIIVVADIKKYKYNKVLLENKEKYKLDTQEEKIKNEEIITNLRNSNILEIREAFEFIENKILFRKKNIKEWYEIYSSRHDMIHIGSNRQLCKAIEFYDGEKEKEILVYDLVYDILSQQAHGITAIDSFRIIGGEQRFRKYDCLSNGAWQINSIYKMLLKIVGTLKSTFDEEFYIDRELLVKYNEEMRRIKEKWNKAFKSSQD